MATGRETSCHRRPARPRTRLAAVAAAGLASIGIGIALESQAQACSCVQPPPPRAAAADATVVFEGRTFGVQREAGKSRFTFDVSRVFKGEVGPSIDVYSASHSAMCGRSFEAGVPYLVYAHSSPAGVMVDSMCSRTRASRSALEDFAELGAGTPPPRPSPSQTPGESVEAPRIETGPPMPVPSKRGCSVAGDRQSPIPLWLALLPIAATRRRRPVPRSL